MADLEATVADERAGLVVVDVLNAFLNAQVDSYRDQDVHRRAAAARGKWRNGRAVPSSCSATCRSRVAQFTVPRGRINRNHRDSASAALLVAADPDDETRRVLAVSACNLAAPVDSLVFRLVADDQHNCPRIRWEGVSAHDARLLVDTDREERSALCRRGRRVLA